MKLIFGSGIVGLLARLVLGPSWTIVPFYRSRFFSFNPSLDDNFIIRDPLIDDVIKQITRQVRPTVCEYKRAWSIGGQILPEWNDTICADWLYKIFGGRTPSQSIIYNKERMILGVYDIRINELYAQLTNMFMDELKQQSALGKVTEIGDHHIVVGEKKIEYSQAINTIPLNHLLSLANKTNMLPQLQSKNIHYWHVRTDDLNFEGFNQLLVVDPLYGFYKVTNIAPGRYMFYCHEDIPQPGTYLMAFMQRFEILDGTSITEAMPIGEAPTDSTLNDLFGGSIYNIGSFAQWDWCSDVGSNILRLVKYANRGYTNSKPIVIHTK